jgi:hypothetical protein
MPNFEREAFINMLAKELKEEVESMKKKQSRG